MIYFSPLDYLPLWLIFVATVFIVLAPSNLVSGGQTAPCSCAEDRCTRVAMFGATLGLLAFILAFIFGLAASRFDERRYVVLDKANAIGTTYLRAGILEEPPRTEIRRLLREYVDLRLKAVEKGQIEQLPPESGMLQNQLRSQAEAAAAKDRSVITGLSVQSLNQMIDLRATRLMVGLRSCSFGEHFTRSPFCPWPQWAIKKGCPARDARSRYWRSWSSSRSSSS